LLTSARLRLAARAVGACGARLRAALASPQLVAVCLVFVAGCAAPGRYQAEVARQRALTFDLAGCKRGLLDVNRSKEQLLQDKSSLDAERAMLLKQIEAERSGNSTLREALESERIARATKEDEIQRLSGTYKGLVDSLQAEVKNGQLEIEELRGKLQVRALDRILFDSGSAVIKPEGRAVLTKVAKGIKSIADRQIEVEGHTDNVPIKTPRFDSNWELSVARAVAVARFLESEGVSADHLAATGYAEHHPIASNDNAEGRQRNRRIEIVLAPLAAG
jgi:chemotaxis protein MotB